MPAPLRQPATQAPPARRLAAAAFGALRPRRSAIVGAVLGALLAACAAPPAAVREYADTPAAATPPAAITYFVTADPQINIPRWGTAGTEQTIDAMNALPGTPYPDGSPVGTPRAAIVAGDLVDVVDDPQSWARYCAFYDPEGKARLRFPAYEGIGNHDLTTHQGRGAFSAVQRAVVERHRRRAGSFHYDAKGYHYSWDDGPLHLVQLNLFPGDEPRPVYDRPAPWNDPHGSLTFLADDLRRRVGDSGRPIVLIWHYGLRGWGLEKWWRPDDLDALARVVAPYNVVLILHGHEHAFASYEWRGRQVFMAPSPQFDRDPQRPETASTPKGFLVLRLVGDELGVFHRTAAGWREAWTRRIALGSDATRTAAR
jgi:hypothetical protein